MNTDTQQQPGVKPKRHQSKPESPAALTVSVDRAAEMLGISRNAAYEAVTRGDIPSLRFGRRIRVPKAALEKLIGGALPA